MANTVCIIQEGQRADGCREALERGLAAIAREELDSDTSVEWRPMKPGYAWTAGEPSVASLVVRSVPPGYPADRREALLLRITELWASETGCNPNDIVVTAFDGPLPI